MATFDEALLQLSSELLPSPDISLGDETLDPEFDKSLDLSDRIRSAKVKAPDAVKSFRKRLANKNANVQLRTLLALDTCIKNSGDAFLQEIAGISSGSVYSSAVGVLSGFSTNRSISEDITELIRTTNNNDVRTTTLRLVQNWAVALQSRPQLSISELVLAYTRLKNDGIYTFPPISHQVTAAMIESISAPSWTSDAQHDRCERCRDSFTLTNRRHHCRNCGGLYDQKCSSLTMPLPHFGITESVRVCDGCYKKIKGGQIPTAADQRRHSISSTSSGNPLYPRYANSRPFSVAATPSHFVAAKKEEDDLQLALRLSLQEQPRSHSSSTDQDLRGPLRDGYKPAHAAKKQDEEDPDLAAAIAASLHDLEVAPSAPPELLHSSQQPANANADPAYKPLPTVDLTDQALDGLLTFSQTARLHQVAPHALAAQYPDPLASLGQMQERAEWSRKDLIRGLKDSAGREQVLVETKEKLKEIMRLYEHLLERQVAGHNRRHQESYQPVQQAGPSRGYGVPQPYASAYPSLPPTQDSSHYQPPAHQYEETRQHSYQEPQFAQQIPQYQHPHPMQYAPPLQSPPVQAHEMPQRDVYQNAQAPPFSPSLQEAQPVYPQHEVQAASSPPQYHQPIQQQAWQPTAKVLQARQLVNLPHAPQNMPVQFPNVPVYDLQPEPERRQPEASLIDL